MLKGGGRIFIILGVVVALIVAVGVFALANQVTPTRVVLKPVVMAVKDIPEKTYFTDTNVKTLLQVKQWPQDVVPLRALNKPEEAIGKLNSAPVYQGEPLVASALTGVTEGKTGLSVDLPRGMVAITISITDVGAVAGAILPGDHVDLLWAYTPAVATTTESSAPAKPGAPAVAAGSVASLGPQPIVQTILKDVQVLAVGGTTNTPQSKAGGTAKSATGGNVTFLLSHQDAQVVKWIAENGKVDLALRRFDDRAIVDTEQVSLDYITSRYKISLVPTGKK